MNKLIAALFAKYCASQDIRYLNKDVLERIGHFASPSTRNNMALATKEFTLKSKSYAKQNGEFLLKFFQNLDNYISTENHKYNKDGVTKPLFVLHHHSVQKNIDYIYSLRLWRSSDKNNNRVLLIKTYTNYKRSRETIIINYEYTGKNLSFEGKHLSEMMQNKSLPHRQEMQVFLSNIQGMTFEKEDAFLKEWKDFISTNKPSRFIPFEWMPVPGN